MIRINQMQFKRELVNLMVSQKISGMPRDEKMENVKKVKRDRGQSEEDKCWTGISEGDDRELGRGNN